MKVLSKFMYGGKSTYKKGGVIKYDKGGKIKFKDYLFSVEPGTYASNEEWFQFGDDRSALNKKYGGDRFLGIGQWPEKGSTVNGVYQEGFFDLNPDMTDEDYQNY